MGNDYNWEEIEARYVMGGQSISQMAMAVGSPPIGTMRKMCAEGNWTEKRKLYLEGAKHRAAAIAYSQNVAKGVEPTAEQKAAIDADTALYQQISSTRDKLLTLTDRTIDALLGMSVPLEAKDIAAVIRTALKMTEHLESKSALDPEKIASMTDGELQKIHDSLEQKAKSLSN
jgi:hypothetical protein